MPAEKIARRPLTIGNVSLAAGDVVTDEVESLLPPGRMKVLVNHGWVSERPVQADLAEVLARLSMLEDRVNVLEARRGPGRPRKVEE